MYTRPMVRPGPGTSALSWSLRVGAVYDWILAGLILSASPGVMRILDFPPPSDLFLFRTTALPPLLFPVIYLIAAQDPARRPWAVKASILLRLGGGILLAGLALLHHPPGFTVYMWAAGVDGALGLVHRGLAKKDPLAQGDANG